MLRQDPSNPAAPQRRPDSVPRPSRRWKTRLLAPAIILAAAAGLFAYSARDALTSALPVRVTPVVARSTTASRSDEPAAGGPAQAVERRVVSVQAPGWIEPRPYAVNVPALVEGVIDELTVLEGDCVNKGQVVARLGDADLLLTLEAAAGTVKERQAMLKTAESGVASAKAARKIANAEAKAAKDEVARNRKLLNAGGISAGDFRRLELKHEALEARVEEAEAAITRAAADVETARTLVENARTQEKYAKLNLDRAQIRAPIAGVVLSILARPGDRIMLSGSGTAGAPGTADGAAGGSGGAGGGGGGGGGGVVMTLYQPSMLQVRVDVPIADAGKIVVGDPAHITTEAQESAKFTGKVSRIVHQANIQRNTVQFKVEIDEPTHILKPEMLARVRFNPQGASNAGAQAGNGSAQSPEEVGDTGGAGGGGGVGPSDLVLLLPEDVVLEQSGNRGVVWLVLPGDAGRSARATRQSVQFEPAPGFPDAPGHLVITSGLSPGDRVILGQPVGLREGRRVRLIDNSEESDPDIPSPERSQSRP